MISVIRGYSRGGRGGFKLSRPFACFVGILFRCWAGLGIYVFRIWDLFGILDLILYREFTVAELLK